MQSLDGISVLWQSEQVKQRFIFVHQGNELWNIIFCAKYQMAVLGTAGVRRKGNLVQHTKPILQSISPWWANKILFLTFQTNTERSASHKLHVDLIGKITNLWRAIKPNLWPFSDRISRICAHSTVINFARPQKNSSGKASCFFKAHLNLVLLVECYISNIGGFNEYEHLTFDYASSSCILFRRVNANSFTRFMDCVYC